MAQQIISSPMQRGQSILKTSISAGSISGNIYQLEDIYEIKNVPNHTIYEVGGNLGGGTLTIMVSPDGVAFVSEGTMAASSRLNVQTRGAYWYATLSNVSLSTTNVDVRFA